jgi:chemotaxis protein methyltransferase CheR
MIEQAKRVAKNIPGVRKFLRTDTYGFLRFRFVLAFSERRNYSFTRFLRLPSQYDALVGPVLERLDLDRIDHRIKIAVVGCSSGAEVYSIASILRNRVPEVKFTIKAFDIDEEMITRAREGEYTADEVNSDATIPYWFMQDTFHVEGNAYRVKESVKDHVVFEVADALDPSLKERSGTSDIVYAQNFLVHLKPKMAKRAFNNIVRLLKPRATLFVDGMDLGLRSRLTRSNGLEPLDYRVEEIHEEARSMRGGGWPWIYWGLEPFSRSRKEWVRRYSTIFLRDSRDGLQPEAPKKVNYLS